MKCLLDTNAVITLLQRDPVLEARLAENPVSEYGISSIVAHELYYGAYKGSRVEKNLAVVELLRFEILDFEAQDAKVAGEIRAELESSGHQIGILDTFIAGQAKARGLAVLTRNLGEFSRVSDLTVDTW
jgi:tRNA(fMet)-specific endonuclease VapC